MKKSGFLLFNNSRQVERHQNIEKRYSKYLKVKD